MSGHLECIGFRGSMMESFMPLMGAMLNKAVEDAPPQKWFRHIRWTDPSGASVAFHLREGSLECITPFFDPPGGLTRWHVTTSSAATEPQCHHCGGVYCDILDDAGDRVTEAVVQLLNFLPWQDWLNKPETFELELAAFAYQAAFFATEADFQRAQPGLPGRSNETASETAAPRPLRLAKTAFVAEGLFGNASASLTDRATGLFTGYVQLSERLTNSLTGGEFQHVRVGALPGAIDVLLDPAACGGEPAVGKIAFIRAWLVGRPAVPPPET